MSGTDGMPDHFLSKSHANWVWRVVGAKKIKKVIEMG
jgi:hypothetical protein